MNKLNSYNKILKASFSKYGKEIVVGVIVIVVGGFIFNQFVLPYFSSSNDYFPPNMELMGFEEIVFPNMTYLGIEDAWFNPWIIQYEIAIPNLTRVTFKHDKFEINETLLEDKIVEENFTVILKENHFVVEPKFVSGNFTLNLTLNNFFPDILYFYDSFDLGILTFKVELHDLENNKIYTREYSSSIKWSVEWL